MPLFFKKKKKTTTLSPPEVPLRRVAGGSESPTKVGAPEKAEEKVKEKAKEVKEKPFPEPKARKGVKAGEAWRVLKTPHVTEKAAALSEKNQYVFKVWPRANKTEIGKAIKDIYGVDVLSVRIIKVPRKQRRLGKVQGWRKGYKKAIIKIKEGQKIEVLPR